MTRNDWKTMAMKLQREVTHRAGRIEELEAVLQKVLTQLVPPYRLREEIVVAIVRSALQGSVPGGSPTQERG